MTRERHRGRFGGSKRKTGGGPQPRPAFGLRPWFALLRRARSLRRFAFAIVDGIVPAGRPYRSGRLVNLVAGAWRSSQVSVATSFRSRLVGVRGTTNSGLLLRTRSVYAPGGMVPLRIVHVDGTGVVVHQDILTAGRRVTARSDWILELPIARPGPDTGARLTVLPSSDP
jgi:hypothetical protein